MGGGEGAKDRRRLKRLQQTNGAADASNEKVVTFPQAGQKARKDNKKLDSVKNSKDGKKLDWKRNKPSIGQGKQKSFGKKGPSLPSKKDKVKKKPKHLKRKLEQLGDDDAEAREKLLNQMADLQAKKENFHKNNGTTSDSRKKEDKESMEVDSKLDGEKPFASFPRGGSNTTIQSDSEKSDDEPEIPPPDRSKQTNLPNKSDSDSSDDDADSDAEENEIEQRRQRGRRRRGRKDTAQRIEESKPIEEPKPIILKEENNNESQDQGFLNEDKKALDKRNLDMDEARKYTADGKKRYCIGRRPVTDFVVGQKYKGSVVYVKPFGVFFDIGCHSDAFCHVSRLRDDYVESPEKLFSEGDEVEVRIVEIDRKQKKITVSLQSDARLEDEKASVEARKQRREFLKEKSGKKKKQINYSEPPKKKQRKDFEPPEAFVKKETPIKKTDTSVGETATKPRREAKFQAPDESTMTPAELKRARKLARRAVRREAEAAQ